MNNTDQLTPQYDKTEDERIEEANAEQRSMVGCCVSISLILILLFLGFGKYVLAPCDSFPTVDEIHQSVYSPDGAYVAVLVSRPSGNIAPAEGGLRVLLRKTSEKPFTPDKEGHINVEPIYDDQSAYRIDIRWRDNRTLIIKPGGCEGGSKMSNYESVEKWGEVTVISHTCQY